MYQRWDKKSWSLLWLYLPVQGPPETRGTGSEVSCFHRIQNDILLHRLTFFIFWIFSDFRQIIKIPNILYFFYYIFGVLFEWWKSTFLHWDIWKKVDFQHGVGKFLKFFFANSRKNGPNVSVQQKFDILIINWMSFALNKID